MVRHILIVLLFYCVSRIVKTTDHGAKKTIHEVVAAGNLAKVKKLIMSNVDVNKFDKDQKTPLLVAAEYGHEKLIEELLGLNANIHDRTCFSYTNPTILDAGNTKDVEASYSGRRNFKDKTVLHLAAENGHQSMIKKLVSMNMNINDKTYYEKTALHLAVEKNQDNIVDTIISLKAELEANDSCGKTALFIAVERGYDIIFQKLVDAKANLDASTNWLENPLHAASKNGHLSILNKILSSTDPNNVDVRDIHGQTAMHLAAKHGHDSTIKKLHAHCAQTTVKNKERFQPLHFAASNNQQTTVELLISLNANVDAKSYFRVTPLHLATKYGYESIVDILFNNFADVNAADVWDSTYLDYGKVDLELNEIIEVSTQKPMSYRPNDTPLHLAVRNNHPSIVEKLLHFRADIDAKNVFGNPTHAIAFAQGNDNLFKKLVSHKAQKLMVDSAKHNDK